MRGKAVPCRQNEAVVGITPAYAGKRQNFDFFFFQFKDHPRLCGEKGFFKGLLNFEKGSPPPMRGKAELLELFTDQTRITPAYAGKRDQMAVAFPC